MPDDLQRERDPGSRTPFKRAKVMFMQLLELRSALQNNLTQLQAALNAFPAYRSRGHGGRHPVKARGCFSRTLADRSKYNPREEDRKHGLLGCRRLGEE